VRVAYAGLSPTDSLIRSGAFRFHPPLPFILGGSFSGRITKVGEGVDKKRIGERVTMGGSGGYADYAVGSADQARIIAEGFDWKLGTVSVVSTQTAWQLLNTVARARAGDVIVVHAAAGAVGLMLVQIGKEMGCKVVALVGSPEKIAWGQQQVQADLWLDYRADKEWPKKVKEFSGGRGANFIFDGNEGEGALLNLQALAPLGQVVFIGAMNGVAPQINIPSLIVGSAGVRGFVLQDGVALTKGAELAEIIPKLQSGKWKFPMAEPVPLEKVADLHRAHEARTLLGRGIISVGGEI
jgi:NADPH2:quinone reductase